MARGYFESCQQLIDDLREADDTVTGEYRLPEDELTVTAPSGFGRQHLRPVLIDFMREFPDVSMRVLLVDRLVDLLAEHVDVAVRINNLPDNSLVARRVGEAAVRAGQPVTVVRDIEAAPTAVHLVHLSHRRVPLKLRAFADFTAPRLHERLLGVAQAY